MWNIINKSKLGTKWFIWLILSGNSPTLGGVRAGTQAEQEREAGAETEVAYWLTPAQMLSYIIQDTGMAQSSWDGSLHINIDQENALQIDLQAKEFSQGTSLSEIATASIKCIKSKSKNQKPCSLSSFSKCNIMSWMHLFFLLCPFLQR